MRELYSCALKMLNRKDYFESELTESLRKKFGSRYSNAEYEEVIELLKNERYIDDNRSFKEFVRWKAESGYGPYYMKERLYHKGVAKSGSQIEECLEELEINLDEVIKNLIGKYRRTRSKTGADFYKSCLTWLQGRGFAINQCIKLLKEVDKDESDFFEGC